MINRIGDIIHKSENFLISLFGKTISLIFVVLWAVMWLPMSVKYALAPSYFSEEKRKSAVVRILENVVWTIKYQRVNKFYTLYGLDVAGGGGKKSSDYIDENSFWRGLNKIDVARQWGGWNQICLTEKWGQNCLLRDKLLFYHHMKENNQSVPKVFAVIKNGKLYDSFMNEINRSALSEKKNYFVKSIDGECASFVKHIDGCEDLLKVLPRLDSGLYILQEAIIQAREMNKLNGSAINTLRIITIYNNGNPYVFSAVLRVGTGKSGHVDNWAAGGLAIGIHDDGRLHKYGFYKTGLGLKTDVHPDSKVKFEEFVIPQYQKALKAACEAHKSFYGIGAIGWDIAVTDDGPVFVEGNDNFEISLMQACNGGLKKEWKKACTACTVD